MDVNQKLSTNSEATKSCCFCYNLPVVFASTYRSFPSPCLFKEKRTTEFAKKRGNRGKLTRHVELLLTT